MELDCSVASYKALNENTYQVILQPLDASTPEFLAGQYLQIHQPSGEANALSIAGSPGTGSKLELHIQELAGDPASRQLVRHVLTENVKLRISLPHGDCYIDNNWAPPAAQPLLFIVASTGYSQAQSLISEIISRGLPNPIHLYWGARRGTGFYVADCLEVWRQQNPAFHYHLVVSENQEGDAWQGREGLLLDAVKEDFERLDDVLVYLCGSPAMVYATLDELTKVGLKRQQTFSDVFSYAPRD